MTEPNRVRLFFEDMSISSDYHILEWGKDDDELKTIAAKKGITLPSKDLSIFKCRYAMVDQQNRNKCTLPRKEVKKGLKTLVGKAIDKDHLRKATIGYWLDSELEDNDIIAYGAFWKSNFPEDYQTIQDRMAQGKMKISFEAWGDRKFKEDGGYDLLNIEFAGGALLFDTEPAFPDAEVMEFSTNRVLEFAKIVEETVGKEKEEEKILQVETPVIAEVDAPKSKMTESLERHDKGGLEVDEILKKYNKASVEELIKFIDESVAGISVKDAELATLKTEKDSLLKTVEEAKLMVENAKIELEKVKVEAKAIQDQLDARLAAEKAAAVKTRRDELGEEFAKDLTDDDIMMDLKFENAKLKKELAQVKAKAPEKAGLESGAKETPKDESFLKQSRIQEQAFMQEGGAEE